VEPAGARAAGTQHGRFGRRETARGRSDPFRDSLYEPELDAPVIERLGEVAEQAGAPAAQIALSWLLHKPGVTAPIVGATKLEHLEDALAAEQLSLSEEQIVRLEEPYVPHEVSGIDL
jgi:aryl-alcohol dehydrogenase-like predicted oxidoreductase